MNTDATHASAYTFRNVIKRTLWSGKKASRPYFVKESLSETFVSPTLDFLRDHSVEIKFNHSLRDIKITDEKVKTLSFDKLIHNLSEEDSVILACPYHITQKILVDLPELKTSPIINIHFKLSSPLSNFPHGSVLGILGGLSQWIFRHHDLLSVTISAAENFLSLSADEIATRCWNEICQALNLEEPIPSFRVIKEKKATLYHSPDVEILRPNSPYNQNLFLAGDWTATSLPCTIEGALYSGEIAASHILKKLKFNQDSLVQN
jgi:predicted NAD/FAD-dependent oxidoreductase